MRRGIFLFVALLALLPSIVIGGILIYSAQTTIKSEKQGALASTVHFMDLHLERFYNHLVSDIQKKAEMPVIRNAMTAGSAVLSEAPGRQEQIRDLVLESVGFPMVGGALIDSEGEVMLSTRAEETGLKLDKTELFQRIINGEASYVGWLTDIHNTVSIEIAVPIYDDGNITGILRQNVDIDIVREYMDKVNDDKGRISFLIRRDGTMFYEGNEDSPALLYHEYQSSNSLEKLVADYEANRLEKQSGFVEFSNKGIEYIGAYESVEPLGCIAVVAIEKSSLFENVKMLKTLLTAAIMLLFSLAAVFCYNIYRIHMKPFKVINDALNRISSGELTARCHYKGLREFEKICENVNNLAERHQKNEKELRLASRVDSLTRLPNWTAIYELLDILLYKHPNQALILFDVEGFKEINDNLGYDIGDRILIEVGDILRKLPQHVCYPSRLGGAEFLVFVTNWTAPRYPEMIAEKIIKEIEGIRFIDEVHVDINVSVGIVYTKDEKADKKKMIRYSKAAMHKARLSGRNHFDIHYPINHKE